MREITIDGTPIYQADLGVLRRAIGNYDAGRINNRITENEPGNSPGVLMEICRAVVAERSC